MHQQSLHLFDVCIEEIVLFMLLFQVIGKNVTKRCTRAHLRLMRHSSTCTDEWCPTASTLPLSVNTNTMIGASHHLTFLGHPYMVCSWFIDAQFIDSQFVGDY